MQRAPKLIASRDNPTVRRLARLAQSSHARHDEGTTLLDGPHLLSALLAQGGRPEVVAIAEHAQSRAELAALFERCAAFEDVERIVVASAAFERVSPVDSASGLVATLRIPTPATTALVAHDVVLLDGIQDPGNAGAVLRVVAAAGINRVLATVGTTELWSPKVLRGAMGAHFSLRIFEGITADGAADAMRQGRYSRIYATMLNATRSLYECDLRPATAWLFGNEGNGLSRSIAQLATEQIRIPIAAPTESLNIASAAAVCLFEQVRQRQVGNL